MGHEGGSEIGRNGGRRWPQRRWIGVGGIKM
jgi:hypothetical protein